MSNPKKIKPVLRHPFYWKDRSGKRRATWYRVIPGSERIILRVTEDHINESIRRHGIGDSRARHDQRRRHHRAPELGLSEKVVHLWARILQRVHHQKPADAVQSPRAGG
jgi:hypothetical protein